jgi:nucleotide-binding universal stress UspA family protein
MRARPGGPATSSVVAFGDPATQILAEGERMHADLIVIGSRGQGRVRQALLGSVAREVLRGANRPVLVVTAPEDDIDHSSEVLDEAEPTLAAAIDELAAR